MIVPPADHSKDRGLSGFLAGPGKHFSPLYVFGGMMVLVEVICLVAIFNSDGFVQETLVVFVCLFLCIFLIGLLLILFFRPNHLYSPSEYGTPTSAGDLASAVGRVSLAIEPVKTSQILNETMGSNESETKTEISSVAIQDPVNEAQLEPDTWERQLLIELLADEMDLERAETALAHVKAEKGDTDLVFRTEMRYLVARLQNGDNHALETIQKLAATTEDGSDRSTEALYYLGQAFQTAGSHQRSLDGLHPFDRTTVKVNLLSS